MPPPRRRHKPRAQPDAGSVTREEAISSFDDHALHGTEPGTHIAIGPVVWNIDPGSDTRHWYFVVATINAQGEFHLDQFKIDANDHDLAEQCRTNLLLEFIQRRPIVVHDFDDELRMAQFCEALCPCDRTRRIRLSLEQERNAGWPPETPHG